MGSRVHLGLIGGAIGGVIDKVQSLISALGRIKVPSIKLPSLGGLGIVQRQRFDHERWRYVHEAHASAQENGGWRFCQLRPELPNRAGRRGHRALDRPLDQGRSGSSSVSLAQGKLNSAGGGNQRGVDASGWVIQTPTKDPEAVAREVPMRRPPKSLREGDGLSLEWVL